MNALLVLAVLALPQEAPTAPTQVLFLGNSYTGVNDLPSLLEGFAKSAGHQIRTERNTPGGYTFASNPSSHSTSAVSLGLIASAPWDFVVLQEQSYTPTISFTKTNYMFPGATVLDTAIHVNDPASQTLFYQTWGRRFGGQYCWGTPCSPLFADFDAMQDSLTAAYDDIALQLGAEVAPVGEAWRLALATDPTLVLHSADDSHPNLKGSYLAAAIFFGKVFGESPVGNGFNPGLPAADAAYLQDMAAHTIWDATCGITSFATAGTPNPMTLAVTGSARLGDTLTFATTGVPALASSVWYATSFGQADLPFLGGALLIDAALLATPIISRAPGQSWLVPLPTSPAFTGVQVFAQSFADDGAGFSFSGGARIEICP